MYFDIVYNQRYIIFFNIYQRTGGIDHQEPYFCISIQLLRDIANGSSQKDMFNWMNNGLIFTFGKGVDEILVDLNSAHKALRIEGPNTAVIFSDEFFQCFHDKNQLDRSTFLDRSLIQRLVQDNCPVVASDQKLGQRVDALEDKISLIVHFIDSKKEEKINE